MPTRIARTGLKFSDIRDGQLVEIVNTNQDYADDVGKPAQKSGSNLIVLGEPKDEVFECDDNDYGLRFRILGDGESIVVTENA